MNPSIFLFVIFSIITYWMYIVYEPFLLDIAIALLLAMATANANKNIADRTNLLVSSTVLTVILASLLFGPIFYFLITLSSELQSLDPATIETYIAFSKEMIDQVPNYIGSYKKELEEGINSTEPTQISQNVLGILGATGVKSATFIKDIVLIIIFFFFFHLYGKRFSEYILEAIPYDKNVVRNSFLEITNTMSIVAYSILFTALFEGFLFGFFLMFFGYDWILFGILYGFASLIPVIGGIIMWLPVALYEIGQGSYQNAIIIVTYSIVVISIVADTFIRPVIIEIINKKLNKTGTKINSLLIFFSIVAGLTAFGFWGAIIGPGITALFIGVINIFREENRENKLNTTSL